MKSELDTSIENLSELLSRVTMWSDDIRICGMKQLIVNPLCHLKKLKASAESAESANTSTNSQRDEISALIAEIYAVNTPTRMYSREEVITYLQRAKTSPV